MIRIAHACGADLIKGQAFRAEDITSGSMPKEFYEQCAFTLEQYLELIDYARDIGNDLFYSIFSTGSGFNAIRAKQGWQKITGAQSRQGLARIEDDSDTLIVSVPMTVNVPRFKKATILHVSDYMTSVPHLWHIETLTQYFGRQAGYSDHTMGVEVAIRARRELGACVIEKHFCLEKNVSFKGTIFRDTQHGATPHELNRLARELSK